MHLFYNDENRVYLTYYEQPPAELLQHNHMAVDEVPIPEQQEGKEPVLMCDGSKVWYAYVDVPPTKEEELEQQITELQIAFAEILGGGEI